MTTNQGPATPHSAASRLASALGADVAHSGLRAATRELGLVVAGTATIALIGQIAVPLPFTPVPITLGTLAALGVGSVLGSRRGILSALLLALLAALGAPVLAGWSNGVTPAFGYVLGFALAAAMAGRAARSAMADDPSTSWAVRAVRSVSLMLLASAVVYAPGLVWLHAATATSWGTTVALGLVPFVVGDVLKSLVAAGIATARAALAR